MEKYHDIFEKIEAALIKEGSRKLPESEIRKALDYFKHFEGRKLSDDDFYWTMVSLYLLLDLEPWTAPLSLDSSG